MIIDLNADVGEGAGEDEALFESGISSANIACGAHAGDDSTMARAVALAIRHGVAIGAHPGFADREHFGRRELPVDAPMLSKLFTSQWDALARHAAAAGAAIGHVKPHGALYHFLNREAVLAERFARAVCAASPRAKLFGPPLGELRRAAERSGLRFVAEGFIDRAYRPDGSLVPRGEPGAVIHEEAAAVAQALALARSGRVETLCVHGDGAGAARLLRSVRAALESAGFRISAPRC